MSIRFTRSDKHYPIVKTITVYQTATEILTSF